MTRKPFGAADLRHVRRIYERGGVPATFLARALGITPAALKALARTERWTGAPEAAPQPPASDAERQPAERPRAPRRIRAASEDATALPDLVVRLKARIGEALESIASDMGEQAPMDERQARMMTGLIKALMELEQMCGAPQAGRRKGSPDDERPPRDMAALRADLVARLERLGCAAPG